LWRQQECDHVIRLELRLIITGCARHCDNGLPASSLHRQCTSVLAMQQGSEVSSKCKLGACP